jgi:GrpB-like predicted nucleotidyltransferase (UPF0157 family)
MITAKQQKWLDHLSDKDTVKIYPYDIKAPYKFDKIKAQIQDKLGKTTEVLHRGASSMGISGQGELDIYIPVSEKEFDEQLGSLTELYGNPGTVYPLERARFVTHIDGTKAEVFLINKSSQGWLDGIKFEGYLRKNPDSLEEYQKLKENNDGQSTREYYRHKIEFINEILEK